MRLYRIVALSTVILLIASTAALARGRSEPKKTVAAAQEFVVSVDAEARGYEELRVVLAPLMKEDLAVPARGVGEQLVGIVNIQVFGNRDGEWVGVGAFEKLEIRIPRATEYWATVSRNRPRPQVYFFGKGTWVNASAGRRRLSELDVVLAEDPRIDEETGEIILSVKEWPADDMVIGWGS